MFTLGWPFTSDPQPTGPVNYDYTSPAWVTVTFQDLLCYLPILKLWPGSDKGVNRRGQVSSPWFPGDTRPTASHPPVPGRGCPGGQASYQGSAYFLVPLSLFTFLPRFLVPRTKDRLSFIVCGGVRSACPSVIATHVTRQGAWASASALPSAHGQRFLQTDLSGSSPSLGHTLRDGRTGSIRAGRRWLRGTDSTTPHL